MRGPLYGKGAEIAAAVVAESGVKKVYGVPYPPVSEFFEHLSGRGIFAPVLSTREMAAVTLGMALSGERACMAAAGTSVYECMEAISYAQAYEIPLLLVVVGKALPGYGNPYPYQGDLDVLVGGDFPPLVVCPGSVEEIPSVMGTVLEAAEKGRMPAVVYLDSALFHMTGTADIGAVDRTVLWGFRESGKRFFSSFFLDPEEMEHVQGKINQKGLCREGGALHEAYCMDDAEYGLCAYGASGYIARKAVDLLRAHGYRAGLLRPISLHPLFDVGAEAQGLKRLFVVEMSHGQLAGLIRKAAPGMTVKTFQACGGKVPDAKALVEFVRGQA